MCAICLEALDDDTAVPLSCTHKFHASCIVPWLQQGNRSCPTCRDKPPRQSLGEHDESDGSESDYPYSDYDADSVHENPSASAEHQLLHEEWEHTWHTWLKTVRKNEQEKRKALVRAKRMATAANPRDKAASREAKRLLNKATAWKEKREERKREWAALVHSERVAETKLHKMHCEVRRWYMQQIDAVQKKRNERNKAAEATTNVPGIRKKRLRSVQAQARAGIALREAEDKLAQMAGWASLGQVPRLPDGLLGCMVQPSGPPWRD